MNTFDIRDLIKRFEELEAIIEAAPHRDVDDDIDAEFTKLKDLFEEVKGNGGDEQWRGDWYPVQFIDEDDFTEYAQELAEDCGMTDKDAEWPNDHIDWEAAAETLKGDYQAVDYDGKAYLYR